MKIWKLILAIAGGILLAVFVLNIPSLITYYSPKPKVERVDLPDSPTSTPAQERALQAKVDSLSNEDSVKKTM
ncbi:hypothetical protein [Hymenobacter terrenus]|uniref:hypothetical protein n=1 Tax=Hymenobacter terrenus TaxID=1629124 RepID=UPI0012E00F02|nr:hypothetical protein [Hymenobacter terrenus]